MLYKIIHDKIISYKRKFRPEYKSIHSYSLKHNNIQDHRRRTAVYKNLEILLKKNYTFAVQFSFFICQRYKFLTLQRAVKYDKKIRVVIVVNSKTWGKFNRRQNFNEITRNLNAP